jgi:hypothetical protein
LERNYIKTDEDSVFTRSHAEFLLSFSIDQSFKRLSKLIRVTGTLENFNLAVNLREKNTAWERFFFLYSNKDVPLAEILRGRHCLRTRTFILFGLKEKQHKFVTLKLAEVGVAKSYKLL